MPVRSADLDEINLFQGTDSTFDFSTGNTYPAIVRPWGMTAWAPQTRDGRWFFHRHDRKLQGLRATHQPSPWIGDYGHFLLLPFTRSPLAGAEARSSAYVWDHGGTGPGGRALRLLRYGIDVELTPSERGAALRLRYAGGRASLMLSLFAGEGEIEVVAEERLIRGWTRANSGGVPSNFACYFMIRFDRPIGGCGAGLGEALVDGTSRVRGDSPQAYVSFDAAAGAVVQARVGTSFIDPAQAALNLERELGNHEYDRLRNEADESWREALGRVEIDAETSVRQKFYSAMHRCLQFPRQFHEIDANGLQVHYSPYDGGVHPGPMYADSGFWDAHRTLYPLLCLLYPERSGEMIAGWLNAYREGGRLPKWSSPGYRDSMVGSHSDVVIAEAIVKGTTGFDYALAYEAIRKNASVAGDPSGRFGRRGLEEYAALGYVPADRIDHSVSRTLDFSLGDDAVARVAAKLGHRDDAICFGRRARNYRNVYDASTGFMRGRNADGNWVTPFDPAAWGGPYCEGGAWQYLMAVPHDPQGLCRLLGGPTAMVARLREMIRLEPRFSIGSYGYEIHEMTEMALAGFGNYAHSNQPVHHALYLFAHAGAPELTRHWVHRVLTQLYHLETLPGDDDNGEMSAWFVLSALGLYPMYPASALYTLTSPLVKRANLRPSESAMVSIKADPEPSRLVRQCAVRFNGRPHHDVTLSHAALLQGGELEFHEPQASVVPNRVIVAASQATSFS